MKIKKAVITAAARGTRLYPVGDTVQKAMLPLADSDGVHKPIIQIIAEEAFSSGVEEICLICAPGDEERYILAFETLKSNLEKAFGGAQWANQQAEKIAHLLNHLRFIVQEETKGYGHAVWCAKDFVGDDPFLLLLSDHLYQSNQVATCATQLISLAEAEQCAVSAVNPTPEHLISQYGTLRGHHIGGETGVFEIEKIIEKPSLSTAELELLTPGMRSGHYLCFFGMHVLTAGIFDILEQSIAKAKKGEDIPLTTAQQQLAKQQKYLAKIIDGRRFNLGNHFGLLEAQIAFGLKSPQANELLSTIVNQLAENQRKG